MKGAAEGLRLIICGSNLFSIKGMRGVRKCHLFWSWEQEFEVFSFFLFLFPIPLCVSLGISRQSPLCSLGIGVWSSRHGADHQRLQGPQRVSKVSALVLGSNRILGVANTCWLQHEFSFRVKGSFHGEFFSPEHLAIP